VDGGEEKRAGVGARGGGGMENGLGAVAVVGVEIPDGDAGGAEAGAGVEGGERDLVEVAEAHGFFGGGVVAGRAHEGEGGLGRAGGVARCERMAGGAEGGGDGAAGVIADAFEERRIRIEITPDAEAAEVRRGMGEQENLVGDEGGVGFAPSPVGVRGAEVRGGADDAGGLLGAHRGAVIGAAGIVENQHGRKEAAETTGDGEGGWEIGGGAAGRPERRGEAQCDGAADGGGR